MSPDGRLLAVGCWDPDAVNADKSPARPGLPDQPARWPGPARAGGHKQFVRAVAFRPDGKCLATIGRGGDDPGLGHGQRAAAPDHQPGTREWSSAEDPGLSWSPDGRRLASAAADGPVRIWDPETGTRDGPDRTESPVRGLEPGRDPDRPGPGR